jgi:hypothetical protein
VNVNKELNGLEAGQIARDIIKPKNGRWVYQDDRLRLNIGDVLYYWLYVQYEGLGYQKLDQTWKVAGENKHFTSRFTSSEVDSDKKKRNSQRGLL